MSEVRCTYQVLTQQPNSPTGTIIMNNCWPPISNDETISFISVIGVVIFIVVLGLILQWTLGHLNRKAFKALKEDLRSAAAHAKDLSHLEGTS